MELETAALSERVARVQRGRPRLRHGIVERRPTGDRNVLAEPVERDQGGMRREPLRVVECDTNSPSEKELFQRGGVVNSGQADPFIEPTSTRFSRWSGASDGTAVTFGRPYRSASQVTPEPAVPISPPSHGRFTLR